MDFSHVDGAGKARMVDVSAKTPVRRTAEAGGKVLLDPETVRMIRDNTLAKGDVLAVARIAGITGAKRTSELIPLCHPIGIDHVDVEFSISTGSIEIRASAVCTHKTGIEMEALTAVAIAGLTIYDMCKAVDSTIRITDIHLVEKTKGAAGGNP